MEQSQLCRYFASVHYKQLCGSVQIVYFCFMVVLPRGFHLLPRACMEDKWHLDRSGWAVFDHLLHIYLLKQFFSTLFLEYLCPAHFLYRLDMTHRIWLFRYSIIELICWMGFIKSGRHRDCTEQGFSWSKNEKQCRLGHQWTEGKTAHMGYTKWSFYAYFWWSATLDLNYLVVLLQSCWRTELVDI